ncbi:MAG: hypothetical protein E5X51_14055 [Mesorhizobium sp.]|nr:MAG: hypothetical protein E5X51_14055 [Mesorhizobium sp.]
MQNTEMPLQSVHSAAPVADTASHDCRGPMSPLIHHISSDETLPKSADVVVIGGGIVGVPPTQLPAT